MRSGWRWELHASILAPYAALCYKLQMLVAALAAVPEAIRAVNDPGATILTAACRLVHAHACIRGGGVCQHLLEMWPAPAALLLQVLVAVRETVWVVDDHGATDQPLPAGCGGVAAMAVSPNGAFVALACNDGRLRVMTSGKQVSRIHALHQKMHHLLH